ncbi:hypothetical protein TNCV_1719211 [Trichonephila clavipes]|nr:hypothetical protein TNCV_1719211 [Trichonephila clavipes]
MTSFFETGVIGAIWRKKWRQKQQCARLGFYQKMPKVFILFDKDVNINLYSEVNKISRPIFFIADFKLRFSLSHL